MIADGCCGWEHRIIPVCFVARCDISSLLPADSLCFVPTCKGVWKRVTLVWANDSAGEQEVVFEGVREDLSIPLLTCVRATANCGATPVRRSQSVL